MKLFDLHCDTPLKLYKTKEGLKDNSLHVSLKNAEKFEKYIQCAAVWSEKNISDKECFTRFFDVCDYFEKEAGCFIKTKADLARSKNNGFILTVEDGRLLCSDIERLGLLYNRGVRVLTLLWSDRSIIGSAWNEEDGALTEFGKDVLWKSFDLGMIPDLSHANDKVISYVLKAAVDRERPVIATHSNSRAVCPHGRNLSDYHAKAIANVGGIVGISLYPPHLWGEKADISHIIKHIEHYIDIMGVKALCLGCDLDGIDSAPEKINNVGDLSLLYDKLSKVTGQDVADDIFFNNAYNFFINNLP